MGPLLFAWLAGGCGARTPLEDGPAGDPPAPSDAGDGIRPDGCPAAACRYDPSDPTAGDCAAAPFRAQTDGSFWRVTVDLAAASSLDVDFEVCDPIGFTLHVGDSPSNNGFGGDGAEFTNDAEVQLVERTLEVYGNDLAPLERKIVLRDTEFVRSEGCTRRWIEIRDREVRTNGAVERVESDFALRLDAPDSEGGPDRLWYVGFGGAFAGDADRRGDGLVSACLRVD